jgi:hypothetical protein
VSLLASVLLAACRQPATLEPTPAEYANGVFEFTIRNGSTVAVGMLRAQAGTVTVTPREGSCYVDRLAQPDPEVAVFKCEGVSTTVRDLTLRIDPRDPQARSRWSATVLVMANERECTAYTTDSRGQTICSAYRTVRVERPSTVGGTMTMKLIVPG